MTDRSDGLPPLNAPRKKKRGFAAMSPEKRREIARKGGAAVPADKRSFAQDRDLAAAAGVKGGMAKHHPHRRPLTSLSRAEANRLRRIDKLDD